jgi:hypothetical protein
MSDVTIFWLIHLFIGLLLPILIWRGCCGMEPLIKDSNAEKVPANRE